MGAETLRKAASLMRERAEAATPGPWQMRYGFPAYVSGPGETVTINDLSGDMELEDAAHVASWHPAVALAVADWLDREAAEVREWTVEQAGSHPVHYSTGRVDSHAVAVARAYLGESS